MGYHDGTITIPIDFEIKSEKRFSRKKMKKQYKKKCIKNSNGDKRRKECGIDKITGSLKMCRRAVKNGIKPEYVLADSWFGVARFIKGILAIKQHKMNVVCGIKRDKKKYGYNGSQYNLKQIIEILKKNGKSSRSRSKPTWFEMACILS